jgi:hypothetical protein
MDDGTTLAALFVFLTVAVGLVIGILLIGWLSRPYDEIGGGTFDRPHGESGDRYPPRSSGTAWRSTLSGIARTET